MSEARWPRLLTADQVDEYTGTSRKTWGEHEKFPKAVRPRGSLARWDRVEVDDWIEALKAERDADVGAARAAAAAVLGRRLREARDPAA